MYSTCIFCTRPLGANEGIETFPVGRRLAFDPAKGRLWVVCRKCERWNLSPIEERWEALEDCERTFRDTRARVSTDNIGLARLGEGLELVRIGAPQRPEFAAWRYGDQFGRRRRKAILMGAGTAAIAGGIVAGGVATGMGFALICQVPSWFHSLSSRLPGLKLRTDDGRTLRLNRERLQWTRVLPAPQSGGIQLVIGGGRKRDAFEGREAERMLALIVPKLNAKGGTRSDVRDAVRAIEDAGGPKAFLHHAIRNGHVNRRLLIRASPGVVSDFAPAVRLGLEMALHEEQERRALEGELQLLEAAWREAEEIAAISDDLLLPPRARELAGGARTFGPGTPGDAARQHGPEPGKSGPSSA